jgi:glycosyltransferase involved in cell wall biosynthesis
MKVSIITVVRNNVLTIEQTIKSIQSQTYKNIEHIIIDGESTDGTLSILKSNFDKFSNLISESDDGIYDAMNKGIKLASGHIIGFLNSDDFYSNDNVISKIVKQFETDNTLDALYADLIYIDKIDSSKVVRYYKSGKFEQGLFLKGWCPAHPTFFVRKSVYEKYGNFDLNYRVAADVELMMRFFEVHKIKSLYIPEVWIKMRAGGASNKDLKSIFLQNKEILHSFKKNKLQVNVAKFLIYKIISRTLQYLNFKKFN